MCGQSPGWELRDWPEYINAKYIVKRVGREDRLTCLQKKKSEPGAVAAGIGGVTLSLGLNLGFGRCCLWPMRHGLETSGIAGLGLSATDWAGTIPSPVHAVEHAASVGTESAHLDTSKGLEKKRRILCLH